jgi:hypothetical protein
MNPLARAAAVAGSLASAAAVVVAVILPVHHATPANAVVTAAGSAAATRGSGGPGTGTGTGTGNGSGQAGGAGGQAGTAGTTSGGTGSAGSSGGTSQGGSGGSSGSGTGSGTSTGGSGGSSGSGSGSGGTGTGGSGLPTVHPIIGSFPHLILPVVTAIPSPTGTIGDPDVPCLQGYVWRQAYSGDYVCVTPSTRSQAASDNAAAVSRVQPGGGAYGKYTCLQGYVWRQVVPDDYTCVTPAVRAQAADDNSRAGDRVALLSLWVSDWTPPSQPAQNCSGDVCTTTEGGWDGPDFQINGDLFNFGPVLLQVRRSDGTVLWSQTVTATSYTGFPGAALYAQTPVGDCSGDPGTTDNDYVIAFDAMSGRWSARLPIDSDCASF